ncbi:MAG: polysaccharide biosynthesis protein [Deltaproteobacteria bacterium]|nr:polysaccharide biosynthesis protein [Deltaproteobacteria bacterium]
MPGYLYKNFVIMIAADLFLISMAWYGAHLLRFNFDIPVAQSATLWRLLPLILGIKILAFFLFDLYQGMWRYTSLADLWNVLKAAAVATAAVILVLLFVHGFAGYSRSVFILDWLLTVVGVAGVRVGIRLYFVWSGQEPLSLKRWRRLLFWSSGGRSIKRLLIIGAGDGGEKIYREIQGNPRLGYEVVGFVDDDPAKAYLHIHGKPVLGGVEDIGAVVKRMDVDEILIAIPSATSGQMRRILASCEEAEVPFKTVPGMGELIDGRVTINAIREVSYRDLLGREAVHLEEERIGAYLKGGRVLVTGAAGSIGSELCRQICRFRPESLILFERNESGLYDVDIELKSHFEEVRIVPVLGDIRDRGQLRKVFSDCRPQVVFHAAAYKHVPLMELHPWKAVKNNILGTINVAKMAQAFAVERFVLVSTDKAVRPTNVMGASKRVAEQVVLNACHAPGNTTRFMLVRFGNVVGSIGSVVPLFQKQIERGGPVTVTHPEVTRYFMTIPEACQLILQAGAMGEGGEVFILDMGTPIKIVDMARDLIRLSGFEPDVDIPVEYIGLRPGEKLYEELITEGEGIVPTRHEKILVLKTHACDGNRLQSLIQDLVPLAQGQEGGAIKEKLKEIVPEYDPALEPPPILSEVGGATGVAGDQVRGRGV